jgi:hypothetical protein
MSPIQGSYEKINYRIRPGKNIERKMFVETFRRLSEFGSLNSYRYVGFGSAYFSDFYLFHKSLGLRRMISIEKDTENQTRFRFNRPFACIGLHFGRSNDVLPTLRWGTKTILWLDYDGRLDSSTLTDISHFCSVAPAGSVIVITVNAMPDAAGEDRVRLLRTRVGNENVPPDVTQSSLGGWGTAGVYRRIINNQISQRINERNGGLEEPRQLLYRQLFNFRYADAAKMLSVGGLIYERRQQEIVERCDFERHFDFVRSGDDTYFIETPNLTLREIHHLDSQLPKGTRKVKGKSIPSEDIEKYAKIYRYFPRFAEAEI